MARTIARDALAMIEYHNAPSALILADSDAGETLLAQAAEAAGCRISDSAPLLDAVARIERQVAADAVLVEVDADPGPEFDTLLDRLGEGARADRHGSVVCFPPELINRVIARAWHPRILHLCQPTPLDRVTAIALAAARPSVRLEDVGKARRMPGLQQLSEEIGRIATILATLSEAGEASVDAPQGGEKGAPVDAAQIRAMIRARRLRDHYFRAELFADPAWDMLLDLLASRLERKRVAVSSLCIAAAVPPTTALRWIKTLTDHGLFVRAADPEDGRRVYIELLDAAADGLQAYLAAAQRIAPLAI